jgi:GNAT superfamily N-acetyltransferase
MTIDVRETTFDELAPIAAERKPQQMTREPARVWFGAYVNGELAGCCSVQRMPGHATIGVYRNDFVRPRFRRRGVYRALFDYRMRWCLREGVVFIATRATPLSLPHFLARGFVVPPDWIKQTPVLADLRLLPPAAEPS